MPLRLDIKKKLSSRSERVKCVEVHPTQPWVLSGLYSGNILVHDYITQAVLKSFEVSNFPVRCAKFIVRTHWLVVGSDDKNIRVYNYNTLEKLRTFAAHDDYIRSVVVHPTLPYIITSSDDCLIKLWDWENNWEEKRTYEGHGHYVMQIALNPKDFSSFATASLDRTIKIWGIGGSTGTHSTLSGHTQGVNCVDYFPSVDKPYLVSGGDDMKINIWDYQTKQCIHTLSGHHHNISSVSFYPDLPLIVSTSEDSSVKIWHSTTFRLETTLNYGMERAWAQSSLQGTKLLALGFDEGTVVVKLGSDEPLASMTNNGYLIWVTNNDIQSANLRINESEIQDGETVPLVARETETCEFFPQFIKHSPNGRSFALCGDGEYVIKSSRAFRNQGYGQAQEFVWSNSNEFAIRNGNSVKVMRDSEEKANYRPGFSLEGIFGGNLLGVRGDECIDFVEWTTGKLIRRINVSPKQVYWSESGNYIAIVLEENFFVLKYFPEVIASGFEDEEGIEEAFEMQYEILESVVSGIWLSDCFIYTTSSHKLNYCLAGKQMPIVNLDKKMYLLGYIPQQARVYLIDSNRSVISYGVTPSFIDYQIAVVQEDFEKAEMIFPSIPESYHNKCAKFLDNLGYKEEAMAITKDKDHKFELSLQLNDLSEAYQIAASDSEAGDKWKMVGDLALLSGEFELAESCMWKSKDWNGLLLLYSSLGIEEKLRKLADHSFEAGKMNIAFVCYFTMKDVEKCIDCLVNSGRVPEAAFFARSYCPSKISSVVKKWKQELSSVSEVAAESLCDPTEFPQKFQELSVGTKTEKKLLEFYDKKYEASEYFNVMNLFNYDVLDLVKEDETADFDSIIHEAPECPEDPFEMA